MTYNQITAAGGIAPGLAPVGPDGKQIRDLIESVLNDQGFVFKWNSKNKQPYKGVLDTGSTSIQLSIYIWRIGDGGRKRQGRLSEKRIQLNPKTDRSAFALPITPTQKTLLLGVYDSPHGEPIFAAWDAANPDLLKSTQKSEWVQVEDLQKAIENGIYQYQDSDGNVGYTFLPSYLGDYIDLVTPGNSLAIPTGSTGSLSSKVQKAALPNSKKRTIKSTDRILQQISKLPATEREALTKQRIGQGLFKRLLLYKYRCQCALCGITTKEMLIGSHIKAWSDCNDTEKLDENNGLLLCVHHDALFDKHLISFEDTGDLLVSSTLTLADKASLQISSIPALTVDPAMKPYLADHRSKLK
jgi:conserved domain protein|nr:HNH endonuclease [uncultured Stomatobaculum sp.]